MLGASTRYGRTTTSADSYRARRWSRDPFVTLGAIAATTRADQRRRTRGQRRQPPSRPARQRGQFAAVVGARSCLARRRRRGGGEQRVVGGGQGDRAPGRPGGDAAGDPRRNDRCPARDVGRRAVRRRARPGRRDDGRDRRRRVAADHRGRCQSRDARHRLRPTPTGSTCCPARISPSASGSLAGTPWPTRSRSACSAARTPTTRWAAILPSSPPSVSTAARCTSAPRSHSMPSPTSLPSCERGTRRAADDRPTRDRPSRRVAVAARRLVLGTRTTLGGTGAGGRWVALLCRDRPGRRHPSVLPARDRRGDVRLAGRRCGPATVPRTGARQGPRRRRGGQSARRSGSAACCCRTNDADGLYAQFGFAPVETGFMERVVSDQPEPGRVKAMPD